MPDPSYSGPQGDPRDLFERLRAEHAADPGQVRQKAPTMGFALDALTAVQAERDAFELKRNEAQRALAQEAMKREAAEARLAERDTENERLREALEAAEDFIATGDFREKEREEAIAAIRAALDAGASLSTEGDRDV